jgi:hypothetical protein
MGVTRESDMQDQQPQMRRQNAIPRNVRLMTMRKLVDRDLEIRYGISEESLEFYSESDKWITSVYYTLINDRNKRTERARQESNNRNSVLKIWHK